MKLSNFYYGTLCKFFPFKQVEYIRDEIYCRKHDKYCREMNEKYGDYTLEDDDIKFIWGIKSWDCLINSDANLHTMNDIDITYDKNNNVYMLGVETAYMFDNYEAECKYLNDCLDAFTKYMDDNELDKSSRYMLFMSNPCTNMIADTIPDLYTNFRIFVNGYCSLKV